MDEDIKLPEPVAWSKPNGEDVITSTSKWLWRAAMPGFVDACSVPCFTADQLRAAVEADRARRPTTPEIDYEALIVAARAKNRNWTPGTNGCVAFKHGAEWFRSVVLASAPAAPQPARKPLTPEQVCTEMARLEPKHNVYTMSFLAGVRFAERMHGIGEKMP